MNKNQNQGVFILLLIFVIPIILISIYTNYNRYDIEKKTILSLERQTKIVDIFVNKEEHNFIYFRFSNGDVESLNNSYRIGDSVSKDKGDSIEYIFRKGKILQNNLLETYRDEK